MTNQKLGSSMRMTRFVYRSVNNDFLIFELLIVDNRDIIFECM